jgi:hypothetical protein
MPNPSDSTNTLTRAGREAGEAFARERANINDRMVLGEVREADLDEGSLLERLFAAYAAGDDISPGEVAELLFGDAAARPPDAYVAAFIEAALLLLDGSRESDEDDEDDAS